MDSFNQSTTKSAPSKARVLLALPTVFLLITLSCAAWQSSQVALASGLPAWEVCAIEQPVGPLQAHCDSLRLAVIGFLTSVLLLVLNVASCGLAYQSTKLALSGVIPLPQASKFGYRVSVFGSFASLTLCGALFSICGQLTIFRLFGVSFIELDIVLVGLTLVVSAYVIWRTLDEQRYLADVPPVEFSGKAERSDRQPEMAALLERISESLHCPVPDSVIYGLEPCIRCTRRPVDLDGTEIRGLTLYISLPLCRMLSEAELMSLIAGELTRCELIPPDWEVWLTSVVARWESAAEDDPGYLNLLWLWVEPWSRWAVLLSVRCLQRSSIVAGRKNTFSASVIAALVMMRWPAFLSQVQMALREGTLNPPQDAVNLSKQFAEQMGRIGDELAASFRCIGELDSAGLRDLVTLIQVDPAEVEHRIQVGPVDRASDCLAGLEALEMELSTQQIKRIFFV